MESLGEYRRSQVRHDYEVARYQAVAIINYTSTILDKRIEDVTKVFPFPWDEDYRPREQTQEEMRGHVMALALKLGAKEGGRKPGDPPSVLAPQNRQ